MSIMEYFAIEKIIAEEEPHPESGDNPDERDKRKENIPEEDDNENSNLESGDNPDERRRGL